MDGCVASFGDWIEGASALFANEGVGRRRIFYNRGTYRNDGSVAIWVKR